MAVATSHGRDDNTRDPFHQVITAFKRRESLSFIETILACLYDMLQYQSRVERSAFENYWRDVQFDEIN